MSERGKGLLRGANASKNNPDNMVMQNQFFKADEKNKKIREEVDYRDASEPQNALISFNRPLHSKRKYNQNF